MTGHGKSILDEHAPAPPAKEKSKLREYAEALVFALLIALVVRALVLQAFKIPSSSMEKTLLVGDHIFVNKFLYGYHVPGTKGRTLMYREPRKGEIVVFEFPEDPSKDFIKRIAGVPGDVVEIRQKKVYVNGKPYDEPWVQYLDGPSTSDPLTRGKDNMPPLRVPPGKLFALGDNRDRSYDSRFWGFVDYDAVVGKAMFIYFSIDRGAATRWYTPWSWYRLVRWERIGKLLH